MNQFLIPTFIPDSTPPYPLRVTSRSLPPSRSNRLRVSWFILGVAFGIGCAGSFSSNIDSSSWITAHEKVMPAFDDAISGAIKSTSKTVSEGVQHSKNAMERTLDDIVSSVSDDTPVQIASKPAAPVRRYPLSLDLKVQRGDTLISMLNDIGISYDQARQVVNSIRPVYNPRKLTAGQNISVRLKKSTNESGAPVVSKLSIPLTRTSSIELKQLSSDDDKAYDVQKVEVPVEKKIVRTGGKISSSLYNTGIKSGLPPALIGELINAYSYDVDFQRDIKNGDAVDVLFERQQTLKGDATGYGSVLFAELNLRTRDIKIYRHVDKDGNADYYNEKGESLRKALLRTPVNGARITSKFGKRRHPILGYTKMHRGVDFGAPTGTPIYAAGDGVVRFVGRKGGYGNYVRIKHNSTYSSAYAHISRFAKGLKPGKKVKQGQIIAYVGSTGRATGPHLHYEILAHNKQINPSGIKFKTGTILKGTELAKFKKNVSSINAQLASMERHKTMVVADSSR